MKVYKDDFVLECPKCHSQIATLKRVERKSNGINEKIYICENNHEIMVQDKIQGLKIVRQYV